jgi:hypothetical protein
MEIVDGVQLPIPARQFSPRHTWVVEQLQQFLIPSFSLGDELVYECAILHGQIQVTMPELGTPVRFDDLGGEPPHLFL